ncbi:class I SAM-dependent DNA methyltransferase, partial [Priestia megaterium]|uniref:class I SAM-dependent DNA methyltransferase n=1 Tax=Priestia megaterium TaxID=1404 RepID=UPI00300AD29F
EDKIIEIVNREDNSDFLYELLDVYNIPKATITRLKNGNQNLTKRPGEVHLKNKVWFREAKKGKLFDGFVQVEKQVDELSAKPRYLLVTDFEGILAKDTKTQEALDIKFEELPQYFDFFLAWKGIEKVEFEKENPADIKAAQRFARLYDVLLKENKITDNKRGLDLFLIRLLFCFFAEDTDIFKRYSFTNSIKTLTEEDGADLNKFFTDLFVVLDKTERNDVPSYLKEFPYVNGQLFTDPHEELKFSTKSRKLIIECGELLNWAKINPDIFGSMIQAVASEESRGHLGMHYTSVPNIMKVIKPLFLDALYEEFEKAYDSMDKLNILYERIGKIKFFDPACGSGNFLIITYKELRRLEIRILLRQRELSENIMYLPSVTLDQFYGIEIDDFAHEIAKLSLWIADHQMNKELEEVFGDTVRPTLPLKEAGGILCANALRTDWNNVCPHSQNEELYVFGNPPYLGHSRQTKEHKADIIAIFDGVKGNGYLDYISGWFFLGAKYIKGSKAQLAFVSTNSICQGEQVSVLWNQIFSNDIQIQFAYESFKWNNSAKNNAVVTVIIVGLSSLQTKKQKVLFSNVGSRLVNNINAYLVEGENIIVEDPKKQMSNLPNILFGNKPTDGGGLIFSIEEYDKAVKDSPDLKKYFRKYVGADEFIKGNYRYVLWVDEEEYNAIKNLSVVKERIEKVKAFRLKSSTASTNKSAERPYAFKQISPIYKEKLVKTDLFSIVIPSTSSSSRQYVPMGLFNKFETILSNSAYGIYDVPLWVLGVLESRMHMTWLSSVGGRLKTDFRYTSLVYNTFPFPEISTRRKSEIENAVLEILDVREEEGGTLLELYGSPLASSNPKPMNKRLLEAHKILDEIVDKVYRPRGFVNDEERLEYMLKMYQSMVE